MLIALLAMVLVSTDYQVPPEPEGVGAIRTRYNEVKAQLDDEFGLYRTNIVINPENLPYPAVGIYREEITLHWWSEAGESGLVLATHSGEYSAQKEYTEVLFGEDGEVLFRYFAWNIGPDERCESRTWYSDGDPIHATSCMIANGITDYFPPSEDDLINEPEYYMELFELLN